MKIYAIHENIIEIMKSMKVGSIHILHVVAKSFGSSNPYNMVRATFEALKKEDSPRSVAARRGMKVSTLQARRRDVDPEPVEA